MKVFTSLLMAGLLATIIACGEKQTERDTPVTQQEEKPDVREVAPPEEPLSYQMVQVDTVLGDCRNEDYFPVCVSITLSYPTDLSGSSQAVQDSVRNLVREYVFENNTNQSFYTKYTPQHLDSLDGDYGSLGPSQWEIQNQLVITYNTTELVSLNLTIWQYTGGAHGTGAFLNFNYDPATGRMYEVTDFLKEPGDLDSLTAIAEGIFREQFDIGNQSLKTAGYWFPQDEFNLNDNFTVSPEGLTFLYNAYEITAYSAGTPELFVPWEDISGIIDPEKIPMAIE